MKLLQKFGIFYFGFFWAKKLFAETCAGSTYTEPTCGTNCSQMYCQDVSFGQDGSVFQCCVSEMPKGYAYFLIAAFILLSAFFLSTRKKRLLASSI